MSEPWVPPRSTDSVACSAPPSTCPVLVMVAVALVSLAFLPPAYGADGSALDRMSWASPQAGSHPQERMPEDLFEKTIRTAYKALEDYTAHAGAGIEFELTNIRTRAKEAFGDLRVIDVATMPDGRVIEVGRTTESMSYPSGALQVQVQYRAQWRTQGADWRSHPQTVSGIDLPLQEAMVLKVQEDPIFQHLSAVTTYDVTATLGDEDRSYRASFYWFQPPGATGWEELEILVVDHITQGVERALRETIPAEGKTVSSPEPPAAQEGSEPGNALATKAGCVPGLVASPFFFEQGQGFNSHIAGSHAASAGFGFNCNCDPSCGQSCWAQVSSPTCADSGLTSDACHKMGYDTAATSSFSFGGGSSCTAAFRCVQKSCLFCQCGLSVSVTISGGQISYSGDSGAWAFQRGWNMSCPSCVPDTGGGGGPGPCSGGVTNTSTVSLDLTPETELGTAASKSVPSTNALGAQQASRGVVYPLHRVETRGDERFIMDEWAIASDGVVVAASDAGFGEAVVEQDVSPAQGTRLLVQKPVHVMNARHVHEPGVLVNGSGLPKRLQGTGEIVAARIEFAPGGRAESVEILSSSALTGAEEVGALLRRRVRVSFLEGKTHRAVAYVVVKLTDHLQLMSAVSALPQCCCGSDQPFCI